MVTEPDVQAVQNGWHAVSRELALAVWGATPDEARARFSDAALQAAEIRQRPEPPVDPAYFANPS